LHLVGDLFDFQYLLQTDVLPVFKIALHLQRIRC